MKHRNRGTKENPLIQLNEVFPHLEREASTREGEETTGIVARTVDPSEAVATDVVNPANEEVAEDETTSSDKDEQPEDGEEVEYRTNDEALEEDTVMNDSKQTESEAVREHETNLDAELVDAEEGAMQPIKMHFASSEYQKSLKVSGKCYIQKALSKIESILRPEEVDWFKEHPQFQHLFHVKNTKQKWMGLWIVMVRSACVAKKYELWFIVNVVPIRYSLREVGLISGLYYHDNPPHHEKLGGTTFMKKYFGKVKRITYADVEKQMTGMKGKPSQDCLKMAVLYYLASVIVGGRKTGKEASPVDRFLLKVVEDLDVCKTFPWGRYAFEQNLSDVFAFPKQHANTS